MDVGASFVSDGHRTLPASESVYLIEELCWKPLDPSKRLFSQIRLEQPLKFISASLCSVAGRLIDKGDDSHLG